MAVHLEPQGRRLYFRGDTYPFRERLKDGGARWDGEKKSWWMADKDAAEALAQELNEAPAPGAADTEEDPAEVRLCGKARYKGRMYYARYIGQTSRGWAARLISLDGKVQFWAPCAAPGEEEPSGDDQDGPNGKPMCRIVKRYHPRQHRGMTQYTTLASIRDYVESQKQAEAEGRPPCAACGKRGELIVDDEDGLMKCRACCDIPSE